jgi:hypothetical protein
MLDASANSALFPIRLLFGLREWMAARCADVDAAVEAPCLERRLDFGRAIGAIGEHVLRCVAPVQEPIQLLAVVDCRIAHLVAPDQLVLGIRIHVVLVAVKALAVLLCPACILVLLSVLRRLLLPILRRLTTLDRLVLLARVALSGHRHDAGIDDLTTASDVPLRTEMLVEPIKQLLDQAGLGELLAEQP